MMLTVGINSYVTLEDALLLSQGMKQAEKFAALTDTAQENLLKNAAARIDLLPLSGRKLCAAQAMAFPRDYQTEVPEQVKTAQVLEALAALDDERNMRQSLQSQGVTAVTLGEVSESYGGSMAVSGGLISPDACQLLRRYIAGSVMIV